MSERPENGADMELDTLKALWHEYDRKLEAGMRVNTQLLRAVNLAKVERSIAPVSRARLLEVAANAVMLVLIGSFAADHRMEWRYVVPAIVLMCAFIAIVAAGVGQIVALRRIDFEEPVIAIQQRLAQLRVRRIVTTKWILLVAPFLWVPLLVVSLRGLFGVDAYAELGTGYLVANAGFGIAVIPLGLWIARRQAGPLARSPFMRALLDDIAGRSLVAAIASLDTVKRFAQEDA